MIEYGGFKGDIYEIMCIYHLFMFLFFDNDERKLDLNYY